MQSDTFRWLVIGALVGLAGVFAAIHLLELEFPSWVGALVPTICAVIVAQIGPKIGASEKDHSDDDNPNISVAGV